MSTEGRHPGAVELSRKLLEIAPEGLSHVVFSGNGSSAVGIALEMAVRFWQHRGDAERTSFAYLRNCPHGEAVGFDSFQVGPGDARALSDLLEEHRDRIAAVIVEPLVQATAGIPVQPEGYLRDVRHLCDDHDVFLICDEGATGFGRPGTMFACEREGVSPDFLCLAEGLTGGCAPLAATLMTQRVHEGLRGESAAHETSFHGHAHTGDPMACAAASGTAELGAAA